MSRVKEFKFGTKAETLAALCSLSETAKIPSMMYFSLGDWNSNRKNILKNVKNLFGTSKVIVRSSAVGEDGADSSMAGQFESLMSIDANKPSKICSAVDYVFASMFGNSNDQVLIQRMVENVAACGVVMTYDVARGSPYYCIEYDDETGRTDVVTSGNGHHKSLYVHRSFDPDLIQSERIRKILELSCELEGVTGCAAIDIEFCITNCGVLYLLQVRRVVLAHTWHPVTDRRIKRKLVHVEAFLKSHMKRQNGLLGKSSILAIMTDWNPAEIIGTNPRPLARSLYQSLITNNAWSAARTAMGYRDLSETELMTIIGNHPYIDVRKSFNSFLPASLPDSIGEKLVDAWLKRLEKNPELHDKVEFEIVPTCIDFTFEEAFEQRYSGLLNADELSQLRDGLKTITLHSLVDKETNTLYYAIKNSAWIANLALPPVPTNDGYSSLSRACHLIKLCRKHGTIPFAIAARHAFIAEAILRSAVDKGALTSARLTDFKRSIRTISGTMLNDFAEVSSGQMTRKDFLSTYGHLRPGTYEITSLRYDERDDLFTNTVDALSHQRVCEFSLTDAEHHNLAMLLSQSGLEVVSPEGLLNIAAASIAARENVKFEFTRVLSDALVHIQQWAVYNGLSREDVAFLEWSSIERTLTNPLVDDPDRHLLNLANDNMRDTQASEALKFPHIISYPSDIYVATLSRSVPNFIGLGAAQGHSVTLSQNPPSSINLKGRIVFIENADPGFDWIFTKQPLALVTRFGGANSHMAVRCAELGIPAAIGCGDQLFNRVSQSRIVEIDCKQKILRPIHG